MAMAQIILSWPFAFPSLFTFLYISTSLQFHTVTVKAWHSTWSCDPVTSNQYRIVWNVAPRFLNEPFSAAPLTCGCPASAPIISESRRDFNNPGKWLSNREMSALLLDVRGMLLFIRLFALFCTFQIFRPPTDHNMYVCSQWITHYP